MGAIAYSTVRYLASKKTVDDRALNKDVVRRLRAEVASVTRATPRVLEIGAGIGTMTMRLVDWGVIERAEYSLLDVDADSLGQCRERLTGWARDRGCVVEAVAVEAVAGEGGAGGLRIRDAAGVDLTVWTIQAEIAEFLRRRSAASRADLLIASAVLDLVDLPATLPGLLDLVEPAGLFWFSINYDGETTLQPDHADDERFMRAYNRSMDERIRYGRPAGHSRTGRRLFHQLAHLGAIVLAAGASDWVVHAPGSEYEADEAYFLHHIVRTIDEELGTHADIDRAALASWVALRHAQIEAGDLVYVAHQLDFLGRRPR